MKRQLQPRNGKVKKAKIQEMCRVAFFPLILTEVCQ